MQKTKPKKATAGSIKAAKAAAYPEPAELSESDKDDYDVSSREKGQCG
jgi:hypothetical protein